MFDRIGMPLRRLSRFSEDESGSASTEWAVAVSVVIMLAVPVMAVIGDGTEISSENVVISIQDADSFGGNGFGGDDGEAVALDPNADDYNPGEDLGVGFPSEGSETASETGSDTQAQDRPRFYTSASGGIRRDKPQALGARARRTGGPAVQGSNPGGSDILLPTGSNRQVVLGSNECFVRTNEQTADVSDTREALVITSGR